MKKSENKTFLHYKTKLGITTKKEEDTLLFILKRDWNRGILLIDIEIIKENDTGYNGFIHVKYRTNKGSYDFSIIDPYNDYCTGKLYKAD